jgi:hypothetical protein
LVVYFLVMMSVVYPVAQRTGANALEKYDYARLALDRVTLNQAELDGKVEAFRESLAARDPE